MSDLVRVRARVRVKVRARVSARIRVRSSVSVSVSVSFTRLVSGASGRARVKYPTRGPRSQTARARNGQTSSYLGRVRATRVRVRDMVRIRIRNGVRLSLGLGLGPRGESYKLGLGSYEIWY